MESMSKEKALEVLVSLANEVPLKANEAYARIVATQVLTALVQTPVVQTSPPAVAKNTKK